MSEVEKLKKVIDVLVEKKKKKERQLNLNAIFLGHMSGDLTTGELCEQVEKYTESVETDVEELAEKISVLIDYTEKQYTLHDIAVLFSCSVDQAKEAAKISTKRGFFDLVSEVRETQKPITAEDFKPPSDNDLKRGKR